MACLEYLNNCCFPSGLNDTSIILIPKKANLELMFDLRPIALCNVLYKIVVKMLTNRLKIILPSIISNSQYAFVLGRLISDNNMVAFELLHFIKRKS